MNRWIKAGFVFLALCNIAGLYIWAFSLPVSLQMQLGLNVIDPSYNDALQAAVSLGRLDAISVLLAIIGIMLGLLALFGFGYIKHRAEQVAKETADEVARETLTQWKKRGRSENGDSRESPIYHVTENVDFSSMDKEEETGGVQ
ncbi:MAG: hypothetical protein OXI87_20790 [Albidovulum sp.]|nr:hypothetical protein [Albidovulum sp.]